MSYTYTNIHAHKHKRTHAQTHTYTRTNTRIRARIIHIQVRLSVKFRNKSCRQVKNSDDRQTMLRISAFMDKLILGSTFNSQMYIPCRFPQRGENVCEVAGKCIATARFPYQAPSLLSNNPKIDFNRHQCQSSLSSSHTCRNSIVLMKRLTIST